MLYVVIIFLIIIVSFLALKVYALKLSVREIAEGFEQRIREDTNQPLFVSGRDKDIVRLTNGINEQLKILRREHHRYTQGDVELRTAVTNISHDLRTPLTAICGYLSMMERIDKPEQIEKYLSIISERTDMMKQLTEELFRYSVILSAEESGSDVEEVLINQALEDGIMGYYAAFTERGITPQVDITENKVIRRLDRGSLSRVFSNLLNNALKYSDGDMSISLDDSGTMVFSNSASGLTSVQVERLFDRFYTVEAARNSTGLGLSISRTLIERMGGSISAEYLDGRLVITIRI